MWQECLLAERECVGVNDLCLLFRDLNAAKEFAATKFHCIFYYDIKAIYPSIFLPSIHAPISLCRILKCIFQSGFKTNWQITSLLSFHHKYF